MTNSERKQILAILDEEWAFLSQIDLNHNPSLMQYASAVWTLLELLPTIKPES